MSKFIMFLFSALLVCGNAKADSQPFKLPRVKHWVSSRGYLPQPFSHPDGLPWVNVTGNEARLLCKSLGDGYSLISNPNGRRSPGILSLSGRIGRTVSRARGNSIGGIVISLLHLHCLRVCPTAWDVSELEKNARKPSGNFKSARIFFQTEK